MKKVSLLENIPKQSKPTITVYNPPLNRPTFGYVFLLQHDLRSTEIHRPSMTCRGITTTRYLEDHPRTCKWLGSSPFISHVYRPLGRGPTLPHLGDVTTITMSYFHHVSDLGAHPLSTRDRFPIPEYPPEYPPEI